MPEYLDIVNENDTVIGKDTRENVHSNHQIHRGVHVLVINSEGKILVQKRSTKKKDRPGYLDASVGAQVRSGESYEQAALRETKEELGYTPAKLTYITQYKSYSSRQRENRQLFIIQYDGPFKVDHMEVDSVIFLSLEALEKRIAEKTPITDGFVISIEKYREYLLH